MTTLARFLAGVTLGVIAPLGVILGLAYLSGEDPQVVVHGNLSEIRKSELRSVVEQAIAETGRWVTKPAIRDEAAKLPWVVKTRVWRTVTNSLHIDVLESIEEQRPTERLAKGTEESLVLKNTSRTQAHVVSQELVDRLKKLARVSGDPVETVDHSSEGLVITLESGTSVLLGNRDFDSRMQRFLTVAQEIEIEMDMSRLVADARYDTGVAVAAIDIERDKSYDTDASITNDPVVITHE